MQDYLPVLQEVERKVLKTLKCGFEAHLGDFTNKPITPNDDILLYINEKYIYEDGQVIRILKNGDIKVLGTLNKIQNRYFIDIKLSRISIGRRLRRSHIVWFLCTGEWPSKEIDHEDRDTANDQFENLREVTTKQNAKNRDTSNIAKIRVYPHKSRFVIEAHIYRKHVHLIMCNAEGRYFLRNLIVEHLNKIQNNIKFY